MSKKHKKKKPQNTTPVEDSSEIIEELEVNVDDSNETIKKIYKIKSKGKNTHQRKEKTTLKRFGVRKG